MYSSFLGGYTKMVKLVKWAFVSVRSGSSQCVVIWGCVLAETRGTCSDFHYSKNGQPSNILFFLFSFSFFTILILAKLLVYVCESRVAFLG